jgi:hypothetical protein
MTRIETVTGIHKLERVQIEVPSRTDIVDSESNSEAVTALSRIKFVMPRPLGGPRQRRPARAEVQRFRCQNNLNMCE